MLLLLLQHLVIPHLVLQHLLSLLNRHVGIDVVGIHVQVGSIYVQILVIQVGIGIVVHVHIHVPPTVQPLLVLTHYYRHMSTVHFLDYRHRHGRYDLLLVAVEDLVPCVHVGGKMGDL